MQEQLRLAIQEIASLSARVHELEVRQQERQDDGGAPLVMPYLQIHQSLSGLATGVRRISSVPSITQDGSGGSTGTTAALRLQQANGEHKPSTPRAANGHAKSAGSPLGLRTPSGDLSNLEISMAVSKIGGGDTRASGVSPARLRPRPSGLLAKTGALTTWECRCCPSLTPKSMQGAVLYSAAVKRQSRLTSRMSSCCPNLTLAPTPALL